MNEDPRKNSEGYLDLTPYEAEKNIEKEKIAMVEQNENVISENQKIDTEKNLNDNYKPHFDPVKRRFYNVLDAIYKICMACGFRIEGRICLRDIKTGRVFK